MDQFIVFLTPCRESLPEDASPEEQKIVMLHFNYLQDLLADGTLILAGRTQTRPYRGIAIIEAPGREEAERLMREDPAIQAGVFTGKLQEYKVALLRGD